MTARPLEVYHERTRRRGVNTLVYWPARWVIKAAILVYFRVRRLGREHIPRRRPSSSRPTTAASSTRS